MADPTTTIRDWPPPLLTEHFTLEEFAQPAGLGLPAAHYPAEWIEGRLLPLCRVLEVLREELGGVPIEVISGYRSREYNAALLRAGHKVSKASQHMAGYAADIQVAGTTAEQVHATALRLHKEGAIRLGGLGSYPSFTHLDLRPGALVRWSGTRSG